MSTVDVSTSVELSTTLDVTKAVVVSAIDDVSYSEEEFSSVVERYWDDDSACHIFSFSR